MKELTEEREGFIQVFEEDCFGFGIDASTVDSFRVIKDSWYEDENGRQVRRIQKAIALSFIEK